MKIKKKVKKKKESQKGEKVKIKNCKMIKRREKCWNGLEIGGQLLF
jgi:hypothetical protein